MPSKRWFFWLLACFTLHFALVGTVCLHETLWLLKKHLTLLPVSDTVLQELDEVLPIILGDGLAARNPWRLAIVTYRNATGIEAGYGYFAPNVPGIHALVFECHYPDGRVDYQTPSVQGKAAELRLTSLIEQIAKTEVAPWRDELIRQLARSTWQQHPEAVAIRAFFGSVTPPTVAEFAAGKRERTFDCLYTYDFRRDQSKATPSNR